MKGLALAYSEEGCHADTERVYCDATQKARDHANNKLLSSVLRNYGVYLSDFPDRHDEAEQLLKEAVTAGETSRDKERHGEALSSLGIFLQHQQRPDEATPFLQEALDLLYPANTFALHARSHLDAIYSDADCHCNNMEDSIAASLQE